MQPTLTHGNRVRPSSRISSGLRPTPPPRLAAQRVPVRRYQGMLCGTPVTQKCGRKPTPKNSQKVCEISQKIVENWSQEAPRGTQNQEKWSLGGTLEPSWGVLGTQVDPRWKKDDFLGLSPPPPPRTLIFSLLRIFSAFFSNFFFGCVFGRAPDTVFQGFPYDL